MGPDQDQMDNHAANQIKETIHVQPDLIITPRRTLFSEFLAHKTRRTRDKAKHVKCSSLSRPSAEKEIFSELLSLKFAPNQGKLSWRDPWKLEVLISEIANHSNFFVGASKYRSPPYSQNHSDLSGSVCSSSNSQK